MGDSAVTTASGEDAGWPALPPDATGLAAPERVSGAAPSQYRWQRQAQTAEGGDAEHPAWTDAETRD